MYKETIILKPDKGGVTLSLPSTMPLLRALEMLWGAQDAVMRVMGDTPDGYVEPKTRCTIERREDTLLGATWGAPAKRQYTNEEKEKLALEVAHYMLTNNISLMRTLEHFGIAHSTGQWLMHLVLPKIDKELADKVEALLASRNYRRGRRKERGEGS
jgi:hypothetical protein